MHGQQSKNVIGSPSHGDTCLANCVRSHVSPYWSEHSSVAIASARRTIVRGPMYVGPMIPPPVRPIVTDAWRVESSAPVTSMPTTPRKPLESGLVETYHGAGSWIGERKRGPPGTITPADGQASQS